MKLRVCVFQRKYGKLTHKNLDDEKKSNSHGLRARGHLPFKNKCQLTSSYGETDILGFYFQNFFLFCFYYQLLSKYTHTLSLSQALGDELLKKNKCKFCQTLEKINRNFRFNKFKKNYFFVWSRENKKKSCKKNKNENKNLFGCRTLNEKKWIVNEEKTACEFLF